MSYTPQTILQWLSAASIPICATAIKYASNLNRRFIVLETLFNEKSKAIERMETQQKEDGIKLAMHDQLINQVKADVASINVKLEPLPRIATILEQMAPALQHFVPRTELEHRFSNLEQSVSDLRTVSS